jgi:fatty-acyl-CoA synthase
MSIQALPTIFSLTARALTFCSDRVAFKTRTVQWTGTATLDFISRAQRVLAGNGIKIGSKVALLTANRVDSWCFGVAAQGLGAAVTSLHPMGSADAHRFQLEDAEVSVLVLDSTNYLARGAELTELLPGVIILTLGEAPYGKNALTLVESAGTARLGDVSSPQDIGMLSYTGGTTGRPKGVARSNAGSVAVTLSVLAEFELPHTPRYLAIAPISHVSGTNVVPALLRGGTVHLLERFDPDVLLSTIAGEKINFTLMVPTMIYGLLDHPALEKHDVSSLELLLYGAAAMSPDRLLEGIERIGPIFSQLYGQTECYPIAVLRKGDHDRARPKLFEACGFPTAACSVRLLDDNNQDVPPGEPGEICVRGPMVMSHYWRQPEQTESALAGGWLHTGDIARADAEGRLYIVDRKKDMIVSGGFNIYPREVEDVLASHPGVSMAAVIGVPDKKWGESVFALIVRKPESDVSEAELVALVKERKGSLHAPKEVSFVAQLPLTVVGKIDKKAIRASFWSAQGRMVG